MNRKRIMDGVGIIVALALLLSACSASTGTQTAAKQTAPAPVEAVDRSNILVEGRLLPNQSINLAFLSGGRIKELLVAEGSDIQAGQVIARLDGEEQILATIQAAQFELLSSQQAIDDLNENYAGALADAQQQLAQAKIDLKKAQDDRTSMVYRRASGATLDGLRADLILAQQALDDAQSYYDSASSSSDSLLRAQALRNLASAKQARDRAQYNLNYASDLPDKDEIDRSDANVKIAEARLETARTNLDRLATGPDPRALALAQARKQKAETNLTAAQTQLANLELKAPFNGRIVNLKISLGEQVSPGQVIASLVDFSRWIVETNNLTELNVVKIKVGQQAQLVADALPDETLTGTVERISNSFVEKQGDITYTVRVALDKADERLRWGMTFAVTFQPSADGQAATSTQAQPSAAPTAVAAAETTTNPADPKAAETVVKAYFAALEKQDAQTAAGLLSNYSLVAERTTRDAAVETLKGRLGQGTRWSDLAVKESKAQGDATVLVHVTYQLAGKDAKTGADTKAQQDEWWPARFESGQWLYNWNNVIDFRGVDVEGQTTGGLTLNPVQLTRYPDHIALVLFAQNRATETMILGQPNEILALFTFGEKTAEAERTPLVFEGLKTYPDARIVVKGSFESYPDKVEIRKWKDNQTAPWYSFKLGE